MRISFQTLFHLRTHFTIYRFDSSQPQIHRNSSDISRFASDGSRCLCCLFFIKNWNRKDVIDWLYFFLIQKQFRHENHLVETSLYGFLVTTQPFWYLVGLDSKHWCSNHFLSHLLTSHLSSAHLHQLLGSLYCKILK